MNTIKSLIFRRFSTISLLFLSMAFGIVLLMLRIKLHHSPFYLFLVWNLFLAIIPYAITTYLSSIKKLNILVFVPWVVCWILFLPNAPYIITDLLHLKLSSSYFMWLDVLMVTSFALNGLLLFYLSILDMELLLNKFINQKKTSMVIVFIIFLTGFGMYLGRFLRFNSWDIIQQPQLLIRDVFKIITHPKQHFEAWTFTIAFGLFLLFTYNMFKELGYYKIR